MTTAAEAAVRLGLRDKPREDLFGNRIAKWYKSKPETPPFTILNARSGSWGQRKRAWLEEIGDGVAGRSAASFDCHSGHNGNTIAGAPNIKGTSGFDPVLAELMYRWYSQKEWQIVDPFAGGTTRGSVASCLERVYWGCDLSAEQVSANGVRSRCTWVHGAAQIALKSAPRADMIFSCPPYGSLERYSDHERDLSAMPWPRFSSAYREIVRLSSALLRPDRFAVFVVGNYRDRKDDNGRPVSQDRPMRNLVGLTIDAFTDAGLRFFDEAHLVTPIGTLAARTSFVWPRGHKLGRSHQTVLIFAKGNPLPLFRQASKAVAP